VAIRKTLGAPQEDGSPRLPAFPLQVFPRPWREWVSDAAQWAGSASSLLSETYLPGTRLVRAFSAMPAPSKADPVGKLTKWQFPLPEMTLRRCRLLCNWCAIPGAILSSSGIWRPRAVSSRVDPAFGRIPRSPICVADSACPTGVDTTLGWALVPRSSSNSVRIGNVLAIRSPLPFSS